MKQALTLSIGGIKCDNCDYRNDDVKVEDYNQWLNKPCPKCEANLLTQADYDNVQKMLSLVDILNGIYAPTKEDEELVKVSVEMDGTGKMDFKLKDK